MSRLTIVDFRTMEKLLLCLGFVAVRQKGAMFSIVMPMAAQPLFRIMRDVSWRGP